jgi:cytochrome c biogenesis protein CcdA/thiol-disulfide isomerase/thioredoxin
VVTLAFIGFLAGLVTGISPCILPVVPVIFAAGAASGIDEPALPAQDEHPAAGAELVSVGAGLGGRPVPTGAVAQPKMPTAAETELAERIEGRRRRRPFAIVAGLVISFSIFTLIGTWLLSLLGLPQDFLRWVGLVVLGLVGLGLIFPAIGDVLERPFIKLARGRQRSQGGGFVLGLSLGLVFVPCAGPVLAAITVVSATHRFGLSAFVLTFFFALGVAVPLLAFAVLGQRLAGHMGLVRTRASLARKVIGAVLIVTALVIGLNLTDGLQRALPGYTDTLQTHLEASGEAKQALGGVTGNNTGGALSTCSPTSTTLQECGEAPKIAGISQWLNTPGDKPLSIGGLKGKVVLIDFWTYSCINCQRTLPHVEAWNRSYAKDGLTIIGVHTPEFAFEHVASNVTQAAKQLGVDYPIALDNSYTTWDNYSNEYWPAEYLIDATGHVRHVDFGEGNYGQTESLIRTLLKTADPSVVLPKATEVVDTTPTEATTPESYLGYQHLENLQGETVHENELATYDAPASVEPNEYAYGGQWNISSEKSTAGSNATMSLNFQAKHVFLVLGGTGTVAVTVDGKPTQTVTVSGEPKLYQLVDSSTTEQAQLGLSMSPGIQAYDFTFG